MSEVGTTFQQVLEEARRELVREYFGEKTLAISQAAFLLGDEDPNTFFRAFSNVRVILTQQIRMIPSRKILARKPPRKRDFRNSSTPGATVSSIQ